MLKRALFSLLVALSAACESPTAPTLYDYGGTWSGNFFVMTCSATGHFQSQNLCGALQGAFGTYKFTFTHSGSSVSGNAEMVGVPLAFSPGQVSNRNALVLAMEGNDTGSDDTPFRFAAQWNLMLYGPTDLQGSNTTTFTITPNAANRTGTLTFTSRISSRSVTR